MRRRDSANQNSQHDWMDGMLNLPAEQQHHMVDIPHTLAPHVLPPASYSPSSSSTTTTTQRPSVTTQDLPDINVAMLPNDHDMDMFMMNNDMASCYDLQQHWNPSMCEPDRCCLNTALDLLRQLSITEASKACPRRGMPEQIPPPTLEMAASMNRNIISSLNTILDCSCSLNGNLLTIISLVTFKVSHHPVSSSFFCFSLFFFVAWNR